MRRFTNLSADFRVEYLYQYWFVLAVCKDNLIIWIFRAFFKNLSVGGGQEKGPIHLYQGGTAERLRNMN